MIRRALLRLTGLPHLTPGKMGPLDGLPNFPRYRSSIAARTGATGIRSLLALVFDSVIVPSSQMQRET